MIIDKRPTADVDPTVPTAAPITYAIPQIKVEIPGVQKQQLYQAIISIVTVILGIALTLVSQIVSQTMQVDPAPIVVQAPADAMQSLGTSHFLDIAIAGDLDVGDALSLPVDVEHFGLPSVVSTDIVFGTATGAVATIADGEIWIVHSVFVRTTTNFDCTGDNCTLTVGDGADVDGFLTAADAQLQAAFTEATGYPAGWFGIENGSGGAYTLDDGGPFVYAPSGAAETIDYVIGGTDPAAGAATIYVVYTRIL